MAESEVMKMTDKEKIEILKDMVQKAYAAGIIEGASSCITYTNDWGDCTDIWELVENIEERWKKPKYTWKMYQKDKKILEMCCSPIDHSLYEDDKNWIKDWDEEEQEIFLDEHEEWLENEKH